MSRFTNESVVVALRQFRDALRKGTDNVNYSKPDALELAIQSYFLYGAVDNSNFNPQTVRRFQKLFDVPNMGDEASGDIWPSQDETAVAIQNFINRRSDPWREFKLRWANQQQVETNNIGL